MNVREAIETIGMQRLAELAGCTRHNDRPDEAAG